MIKKRTKLKLKQKQKEYPLRTLGQCKYRKIHELHGTPWTIRTDILNTELETIVIQEKENTQMIERAW